MDFKKIRILNPKGSNDIVINEIINKARTVAILKHEKQKDDSGKPYDLHCIRVALLLSLVSNKETLIASGYLHDVLEDTHTAFEELEKEFGIEVASLVYEVTHEKNPSGNGYYFPRLKSHDAMLLKFADRLDNLSRMEPWTQERRNAYLKKSKFGSTEPF